MEQSDNNTALPAGEQDELSRLRRSIDAVDEKIAEMLVQRARLAKAVGAAKGGVNVYRPEREQAVIAHALERSSQAGSPLSAESVRRIYTEIISACRALESRPSVAFLGPKGTFTEMAVIAQFGSSVDMMPCASIDGAFHAAESHTAQYAVVPVENSTQGTVTRTMDLLLSTALVVIGEVNIAVRHNLMNRSGRIEDVEEVCAHPQALAQCRSWLAAHLPNAKITSAASNAEAAVLASKNVKLAAIAATRAAELYDLKILAQSIQDNPRNTTRFWVLGTQTAGKAPDVLTKTAIIFSVPNRAGALFKALEPFERNGVSMTRLESRPARNGAWDYNFYVDIEGHSEDENVARALKELSDSASFFKVLGSFPADTGVH